MILPVVICLCWRLSHACPSWGGLIFDQRMNRDCGWLNKSVVISLVLFFLIVIFHCCFLMKWNVGDCNFFDWITLWIAELIHVFGTKRGGFSFFFFWFQISSFFVLNFLIDWCWWFFLNFIDVDWLEFLKLMMELHLSAFLNDLNDLFEFEFEWIVWIFWIFLIFEFEHCDFVFLLIDWLTCFLIVFFLFFNSFWLNDVFLMNDFFFHSLNFEKKERKKAFDWKELTKKERKMIERFWQKATFEFGKNPFGVDWLIDERIESFSKQWFELKLKKFWHFYQKKNFWWGWKAMKEGKEWNDDCIFSTEIWGNWFFFKFWMILNAIGVL